MGLGRLWKNLSKALAPVMALALTACSLESSLKKIGGAALQSVQFTQLNPAVNEGTTTLALAVQAPLAKSQNLKYKLYDPANVLVLDDERELLGGAVSFVLSSLPLPPDNLLDEPNRVYRLVVTDQAGTTSELTITVLDDDTTPTIQWTAASQTRAESFGTVTVTAQLSAASGREVTVDYGVSGTAANPADQNAAGGTLTIAAGSTSAEATFAIVNDTDLEGIETVIYTLSNPSNVTVGAAGMQTVSIVDDDTTISMVVSDTSATEGAALVFTVSLAAPASQEITVDWATANGSADGSDYTAGTGTLTIAIGQSSGTISIASTADATVEGNETITLTISNLSVGSITDNTGIGTIANDDVSGFTWDGSTGNGLWNDPANWAGNVVPGSADKAMFAPGACSGANCNASLNVAVDVRGLEMAQGFTGTLTQGAVTVRVRDQSFLLVGGTFVGSTSGLTIDGNYTQFSGTSFTAGAQTITVGGGWARYAGVATMTGSTLLLTASNATTVYIDPNGTIFSNLTFRPVTANGQIYTISSDATVSGTLELAKADAASGAGYTLAGTGTISASGPIMLSNANANPGSLGGTATILATGTAAQTLTGNSGNALPNFVINKSSGTLTLAGTIDLARDFTYTAGTLASGTSTLRFVGTSAATFTTGAQGYNHVEFRKDTTGGDITVTVQTGNLYTNDVVFESIGANKMTVTGSLIGVYGNVVATKVDSTPMLNMIGGPAARTVTGTAGAQIYYLQLDTTSPITLVGTIDILLEIKITNVGTFSAGTSTVRMVGSSTSTAVDIGATRSLNNVVFNKTGGVNVNMVSALNVAGDLTINNSAAGGSIIGLAVAVSGNVTMTDNDGGGGAIQMVGTVTKTLTNTAGAVWPTGAFVVNKTGGATVELGSAVNLNGTGQDLTMTAGRVNMNGYNLTVTDQLTMAASTIIDKECGTLTVNGSSIGEGAYGSGTVQGGAANPNITVNDPTAVTEGSPINFVVTLSAYMCSNVTVNYTTADNTAVQPGDYTTASGTATVVAGATTATIAVTTIDDASYEPAETLNMTISAASGGTITDNVGIGTIATSDLPASKTFDFLTSLPTGVTFTRSSTATYFNSSGTLTTAAVNTARFDYDPATHLPLGLLMEDQATNLALRSQDLTQAPWGNIEATTVASTVLSPDRTSTANLLKESSNSGYHDAYQGGLSVDASTSYTASVFVKRIDRNIAVNLSMPGGTERKCQFDLATSTVGTCTAGSTGSIRVLADGWMRVSVTGASVTAGFATLFIDVVNGTTESYAGNGQSGVLLWGAQVEAGYYATSYIPTTTTTVTRNEEFASHADTDWLVKNSWTLMAEHDRAGYEPTTVSRYPTIFKIADVTDNIESYYVASQAEYRLNFIDNSVFSGSIDDMVANTAFTSVRHTSTRSGADISLARDGGTVVTSTITGDPRPSGLKFGHNDWTPSRLNGHIRYLKFWNSVLTSGQQQLVGTKFNILGITDGADVVQDARLTAGPTATVHWQNIAGESGYSAEFFAADGVTPVCSATYGADVTSGAPGGCSFTSGVSYVVRVYATTADADIKVEAANSPYRFIRTHAVNFSIASSSVSEATASHAVAVSMSGTSDQDVWVPITVSGTATQGTDFTIEQNGAYIPAGQTTASVVITVINDATADPGETILLSMGTPIQASLGATSTHTVTISDNDMSVEPVYPTNGLNWNDYVKRTNSGGTDHDYNQPDTACAGNEAGFYEACIHGGEKRKSTLTGYTTCANMTITDSLGAFDWECMLVGGVATAYSIGLKPNKRLADLILNATTLRTNSITVSVSGVAIGTSASATWWTNTLQAPPVNTGSGDAAINLASGTYAGKILVVTANTTTSGYNIDADKLAFVVMPGATLSYSGRTVRNIENYGDFGSGDNVGSDKYAVLGGFTQKFVWVEGDYDGSAFPANTDSDRSSVNYFQVFTFSRFRHMALTGGTRAGYGFHTNTISQSKFSNITIKSHTGVSADAWNHSYSSYNRLHDIFVHAYGSSATYSNGLRMYSDSFSYYHNVRVGNDTGTLEARSLYHSASNNDTFVNVLVASSADVGLYTYNSDRCTYHQVTTANNQRMGFGFQDSDYMTMNQIVAANNTNASGWSAISLSSGTNTTYGSQLAALNNASGGSIPGLRATSDSTGGVFEHNILLGGNDVDCQADAATNGFTSACANQGSSTATWRTGLSSASSFIGKVTSDDTVNASDSNGSQTFASITDWVGFENTFRLWGKDGSAFPNLDNRSACVSGTCRIWDWRLKNTDTVLRNTSNDGSAQNGAFTGGGACPAAVHGNYSVTDQQTTSNTFLANATEIVGDYSQGKMIGDDDGLCESNEACIYSPNFGAYQGEGDYKAAGTCTFQNGTVTDVQMYAYPTNGL